MNDEKGYKVADFETISLVAVHVVAQKGHF
jgi:hypothetical protein